MLPLFYQPMLAFGSIAANLSVIRQKWKSQDEANKKDSAPNFPKNKYLITPDVIWGLEMFVFPKNWCALFSCYLYFEIHPFVLLPTITGNVN